MNDHDFDDMLTLAAKEYLQEKAAEFDSLADEKHEFSPQFNKRMKKLLKEHRKPNGFVFKLINFSKRTAAVILLILSVTLVSLLTVKALRAEIVKIFRTFYEKYIDISFTDENGDLLEVNETITEVYLPSYIPEGFVEYEVVTYTLMVSADYINDSGEVISYYQGVAGGTGISLDGEDYTASEVFINGTEGQMYEYIKDNGRIKSCTILWNDSKYYYMVIGGIDTDELLKIAYSLEKQE